jgi:hypothetical protein
LLPQDVAIAAFEHQVQGVPKRLVRADGLRIWGHDCANRCRIHIKTRRQNFVNKIPLRADAQQFSVFRRHHKYGTKFQRFHVRGHGTDAFFRRRRQKIPILYDLDNSAIRHDCLLLLLTSVKTQQAGASSLQRVTVVIN